MNRSGSRRVAAASFFTFAMALGAAATASAEDVPCATSESASAPPIPLSEVALASARRAPDRLGSFQIVIVPGSGLSGNAAALAAFDRAAAQWEAYFNDPITITINADLFNFGSSSVIGSTGSVAFTGGYTGLRNAMVADASDETDDTIMASMPTSPTFTTNAGFSYSGNLSVNKANLKALGYTGLDAMYGTSDGVINFNSGFAFDYDNSNGVSASTVDFESVAAHEIGHLLGFDSGVDEVDEAVHAGTLSGAVNPSTLDSIRFRLDANNPSTSAQFGTTARNAEYGRESVTDEIAVERRMSTGAWNGDGRQAAHWKDDALTGSYIGAMDPNIGFTQIHPVQLSDVRALDLIGYDALQCGNGVVNAGEQCDDSNVSSGDCCSATCQYEANGAACTSDSIECTNDVCNATGTCTHPNKATGTACNDGNYCNGTDSCLGSLCLTHSGNPCTAGPTCNNVCNEAADNCIVTAGTACNDGLYCNGSDTCSGGTCSQHVGNPCTGGPTCNNVCNEAADNCLVANGTACNDAVFCNGTDTCSSGTCSQHAGDPCAAGAACSNVCNESVDNCTAANGSSCNDALFCNGSDTCSGGVCSQHTGDPCTGGAQCQDTCSEAADNCVAPDASGCDDGLFCNGADTCSGGTCSSHAGDPCTGGADCFDVCTEASDSCLAPAGAGCDDDGEICTDDTCDGAGFCEHNFNEAAAAECSNDCPATPQEGCFAPTKHTFQASDSVEAGKDKVSWKWQQGDAFDVLALLGPGGITDAHFCVYSGTGPSATLLLGVSADFSSGWTASGKGATYKDKDGLQDGITSIKMKTGVDLKTSVQIKRKGTLTLPGPFDGTNFFDPSSTVLVQVGNSAGSCWSAAFEASAMKLNEAAKAKATDDVAICGDGSRDRGEQCDGEDDAGCSSGCDSSCACLP